MPSAVFSFETKNGYAITAHAGAYMIGCKRIECMLFIREGCFFVRFSISSVTTYDWMYKLLCLGLVCLQAAILIVYIYIFFISFVSHSCQGHCLLALKFQLLCEDVRSITVIISPVPGREISLLL